MRKSEMADRWLQENVQRWIGSWLDSRRRPKKKKKIHHGTIQPSFSSTISPSSTSLSLFPVPFPFCLRSGTLLLAPPQLPRTQHRLCINEHAPPPASYYPHPSIGCNGYPCTTLRPAADRRYFTRRFPSAVFLRVPFSNAL